MNNPLLLLLGVGAALGLNFPLGKLAMSAGVNPALWAGWISLAAGVSMLAITTLAGSRTKGGPSKLRFAIISGLLSYVMPNTLTYLVIPKIGSGLAAIMFALSPVVTALLSLIFRVRPPSLLEIAGIALGLVGALVIIVARNHDFSVQDDLWIFAGLLIPVFLGMGNIYRTLGWPKGAKPQELASLTNLAAVPFFLVAAVLLTGAVDLAPFMAIPVVVLLQLAVSTTMFLMLFRLQEIGGPTYLSQVGYVAAAVGVVIGVAYFGEAYPVGVWVGAGVIAVGISLSTLRQFRR
jgi:drug/metabolite transporter (DMT)-like permease